jgi:17beta-estradiol 17-dehydrogenase / very-long-chain 3-oxoacyl-CoA reductase
MASWATPLFVTIGVLPTALFAFRLVRFIHTYTRASSIARYCHSDGEDSAWALVTGASDGIGLALSREIAQRGFNVVLHGRNQVKIEGRRGQLAKEFPGRKFRTVIADAATPGTKMLGDVERVATSLQDINLTVLINNVGGSPLTPGESAFSRFDETDLFTSDGWISLNGRFPTHLTAALLPNLLKHQPSLIINISSMADEGSPWISTYSGAKGLLLSWSKGLAREMRAEERDIEVLVIETGKVTGVGWKDAPASFFEPHATTYAAAVLDRVGCGRLVVNGYWTQGLLISILMCLPESLLGGMLIKGTRRARQDMAKESKRE